MPTPCDCGEVVEFSDMRTCEKCERMKCEECFEGRTDFCADCAFNMMECNECGDFVDKEEIKKGRCFMCNETMM